MHFVPASSIVSDYCADKRLSTAFVSNQGRTTEEQLTLYQNEGFRCVGKTQLLPHSGNDMTTQNSMSVDSEEGST